MNFQFSSLVLSVKIVFFKRDVMMYFLISFLVVIKSHFQISMVHFYVFHHASCQLIISKLFRKPLVSVFSIWKSLWVLQKAHIKIVARAIYTCLFFFILTLSSSAWKIKSCCHRCFSQQIRLQITVQLYILRGYSSVRIGFNMTNKHHKLPVVCNMLV